MNVFIQKHTVLISEIDELNHVNNIDYLEWVQEIAHKHWQLLTKDNPHDGYVWYVIRHEIDYLKQAVLGEELTIKTWVGETGGVKSIRHVEISKGSIVLAKVATTFCLLDVKRKRPTRITQSILNLLKPLK